MLSLGCREIALLPKPPLQLVSLRFGEEDPPLALFVTTRLLFVLLDLLVVLLVLVFTETVGNGGRTDLVGR